MVGTGTVAVVAGEYHYDVAPKRILVYSIHNHAYLLVHMLHQSVVDVAVTAPVVVGVRCSRIARIVERLLALYDVGIVGADGVVGRQPWTLAHVGHCDVGKGQVLLACKLADVVRIVKRCHEEKWAFGLAVTIEEVDANFGKSGIVVVVYVAESEFAVGY